MHEIWLQRSTTVNSHYTSQWNVLTDSVWAWWDVQRILPKWIKIHCQSNWWQDWLNKRYGLTTLERKFSLVNNFTQYLSMSLYKQHGKTLLEKLICMLRLRVVSVKHWKFKWKSHFMQHANTRTLFLILLSNNGNFRNSFTFHPICVSWILNKMHYFPSIWAYSRVSLSSKAEHYYMLVVALWKC